MTSRRYAYSVVCVLVILFSSLWATDHLLLSADRLVQNYPWRVYPPLSTMGPFLNSWGIGDAMLGSLPPLTYIHRSLQSGFLPFWNPLQGLGLPTAGCHGAGYMFPVHWLTYGLLSPLLAWHVELAAIMLLSSLSSFAVFRRLTGSLEAAALGATAWAFGGWSIAFLQLPSYAWTLALFPFLLLGVERVREGRPFAHLHCGMTVAGILMVGHLQVFVPALALGGVWALWRAREHSPGLVATMALGIAMASFQVVPMVETLMLSERDRIPLGNLLNALLLPREFLCMVYPTLMGQPSDNFYFGTLLANPVITGREHCVFAGVVTFCLALLAAWRRPQRSSGPVALAIVACLFLSGSPWLYGGLCRLIPPLTFFTPTRFLPFVIFGLCMLSSQGWASLRQRPLARQEARTGLGVLGLFTAGALSFLIPATTLSPGFQAWLMQMASKNYAAKPPYFEGDFGPVFVARVLDHFSFTSPPILVSFLVIAGIVALILSNTGKRMPFAPVMGLLCFDLVVFFAVMNAPSPSAAYFPKNPDIEYLSRGASWGSQPLPGRVMSLGGGSSPNLLLVEGISNFEAYDTAHPGDFRAVVDALNRGFKMDHQTACYVGDEKLEEGTMDVLGLSKIYDAPKTWDPTYGPPEYRGAGLFGKDRPGALRAFLIDKYQVSDRADAMKTIMAAGFNPRVEATLDAAPGYPSPSGPASFEIVQPTLYTPQRVDFSVSSSRPTMLVLTDLEFPGWLVTVNGQPQPIRKAYGFARSVELGAGESFVSFRFSPTGFPYTPLLSGLSFVLLLGYGLVRKKASREGG